MRIALFVLVAGIACGQPSPAGRDAPGQPDAPAWNEASLPGTIIRTSLDWRREEFGLPIFRNGYLVVREQPDWRVYSPDGRVWYPDGLWIGLIETICMVPTDFDFDSRGVLVAAAGVCPGDSWHGSTEDSPRPLTGGDLTFFNTVDGRVTRNPISTLGREWATRGVAFDENHHLFLLGSPKRGQLILRQFREDGTEIDDFHVQFPEGDSFGTDGERHIFPARDRIGVLLRQGGGREWIELDRSGFILRRFMIHSLKISRFAFTADGRLFAQLHETSTSGGTVLMFDSAGTPKPILKSDRILAGAQGNQLVFMSVQSGQSAELRLVDIPAETEGQR